MIIKNYKKYLDNLLKFDYTIQELRKGMRNMMTTLTMKTIQCKTSLFSFFYIF